MNYFETKCAWSTKMKILNELPMGKQISEKLDALKE